MRHEVAHLALHEYLGDQPPRWFDEGYASYAAREWNREDALAANLALALARHADVRRARRAVLGGFDDGAERVCAGLSRGGRACGAGHDARARAVLRGVEERTGRSTARCARRTASRSAGSSSGGGSERDAGTARSAIVGNVTLAGLILMLAVFPLYVARRQRDRRRLAALVAADEAAERAARASAIEALLRGDDESDFRDEPPLAAAILITP